MTHLRGYRADAVLIPEPEDEKLVRANVGVVWFQVEVRGLPVHVREMGTGANAIDAAYRVIGELRNLEAEWNEKKKGRAHFENEDHPINLNIGKIEGGDWASSVPAWCRIDCRISIYPGWNAEDASREIQQRIMKFARSDKFLSNIPPTVTFNGFHAEGYVLEPGSEAESVLADAHVSATGKSLESFMTAGYLDTRVYALYDKIPALCYGPYSKNIHAFDEGQPLLSQAHHFDDGALHRRLVRAGADREVACSEAGMAKKRISSADLNSLVMENDDRAIGLLTVQKNMRAIKSSHAIDPLGLVLAPWQRTGANVADALGRGIVHLRISGLFEGKPDRIFSVRHMRRSKWQNRPLTGRAWLQLCSKRTGTTATRSFQVPV